MLGGDILGVVCGICNKTIIKIFAREINNDSLWFFIDNVA